MKIELYRYKVEGFFTNTLLEINNDKVILSNCDISESNKKLRGKSDYEYFITIEKKHLFRKIRIKSNEELIDFFQKFQKDINLFKAIRQSLDKYRVSYKFDVW